ncbi:MAG TPA: NAD(P)H-hydrate dehydratase [Acidimicrobiales bacterium]|nr:NAD(P)H-hydrate dehydratase [Acidimicrobiales bacterium]
MQPVVTTAEMQAADAAAPVPVEVLVRRAGWAVAEAAVRMLGGAYGRRVVVLAGKGNNGADGRAAAAVLARRGAKVTVVGAGTAAVLPAGDLVIDAAYGTGFRGSFDPPDPGGAPVLAVDIPSGVKGDTGAVAGGALRATRTVTMAALKPGLLLGAGPELAGAIEVADIGLPVGAPAAHLVQDADHAWLAPRPRATHKWATAVWVVAGSPGMRGAPLLCTRAAMRSGAGMVRIGSPGVRAADQPPGEAVAIGLPEAGWADVVAGELGRVKALVVGPGLGQSDAARDGVRALLACATVPTVVDADGLNVLGPAADAAAVLRARPPGAGAVVLTPHDGEFARLAGHPPGEDRVADVRDLAALTGAVVLLKGPTTVVADPSGRVLFAAAGSPRLATAGTGDVLSGMIGAFLARGLDALDAAALAAHVHGRAAALGADGLVAGDLPDLIPLAIPMGTGG